MTYLWRDQLYDTQREVAEAAGVHKNTVRNHLERYGHLEMLGSPIRPNRKIDREREIFAMRDAGVSLSEIGRRVGVCQQRVSQIIVRAEA
ncbi:Sigma-70, region 4 [Paracoccus alcaliphilus]|uniref:Sigma-70, region 4 n=1 Tax=Paracoccus alcaliphilus TaxID=34002 RepID=A0A1H8H4H3_9RHOB|nr:sigma factor-like helix-turn-helix DNA-binding protein [Paracoccus alcaliphilus]WCR17386.1 hypothetical protein JHW40_13695 [Paracoccus alcaliphilus]SEN50909.1 Sigma-70, region 4 [Paracoccus alcaliphilus]